ncbi:Uma2 family endonuclease [Ferruginibacter profundus]
MENKVEEPVLKYNYISEEEYLEQERTATEKHEYYEGEIYAMSGASAKHNRIFTNIFTDIGYKLKGKNCVPYGSDLRIHIPKNTLYTYPDISIICGEMKLTDDKLDTATNPSVIIEILSRSTRNYDRLEKFSLYRDIDTLQEYILVDSQRIHIERYSRSNNNAWQLIDNNSREDTLQISTVNIAIPLKDIYQDLNF